MFNFFHIKGKNVYALWFEPLNNLISRIELIK